MPRTWQPWSRHKQGYRTLVLIIAVFDLAIPAATVQSKLASLASEDLELAVWNMVFSGVEGAPSPSYPKPPYTELLTTPVIREKPFLYIDVNGSHKVFAPSAQWNSRRTTWATGSEPGHSIPIKDFFIAKPTNTAQQINAALDSGKNLILASAFTSWIALSTSSEPRRHGWIVNTTVHSVVVNGSNVTATGFAVEHYRQEQVGYLLIL